MLSIGKAIDKKGLEIQLFWCAGKHSTAELNAFILSNWAELVRQGHCHPSYVPDIPRRSIISARHNDKIVGAIMWFISFDFSFIDFTIIDQEYRGNGIYKILHKFYDERMIANKVKFSKSQLHIQNETIIKAAEKDGYTVEYLRMVKEYK